MYYSPTLTSVLQHNSYYSFLALMINKRSVLSSCCNMAPRSSSESEQQPVVKQAAAAWCRKKNDSGHDRRAAETETGSVPGNEVAVLVHQQSSLAGVSRPSTKENVRLNTMDDQVAAAAAATEVAMSTEEVTGRERLKRHRVEVAGQVWIPDMWGQEELLKDWIDCSVFDAAVVNSSIISARAALVEEGRKAHSTRLRIENSC